MDSTFIGLSYETWEFINSFAPWLSAIGTLAAVVIALYIIRKEKLLLLKLDSNIVYITYGEENEKVIKNAEKMIRLIITNIGFRTASIDIIGIEFKNSSTYQLRPHEYEHNSCKIPAKIKDGEEVNYYFPIEVFSNIAKDENVNKFYFVAETSIGKVFKKKLRKNVRETIIDNIL